jgi:hypothetical protein
MQAGYVFSVATFVTLIGTVWFQNMEWLVAFAFSSALALSCACYAYCKREPGRIQFCQPDYNSDPAQAFSQAMDTLGGDK